MDYQVQVLKMNLESAAKGSQIEEVNKRMGEYATINMVKDI
jgi:hypothetical protein